MIAVLYILLRLVLAAVWLAILVVATAAGGPGGFILVLAIFAIAHVPDPCSRRSRHRR